MGWRKIGSLCASHHYKYKKKKNAFFKLIVAIWKFKNLLGTFAKYLKNKWLFINFETLKGSMD